MTSGSDAFRRGAAVVPSVPRAFFVLSGERPLAYLHDVLTQDVAGLSPGSGALAAVLTDKGRLTAELRVLPIEGGVLLDAEPEAAEGIRVGIGRHAGLAGCELVELAADRYALAAVRGPGAAGALEAAGIVVPGQDEAAFTIAGEMLVVRVVWGVAGFDVAGPPEEVAAALAGLEAEPATTDELEAARIESGRPRFGPDLNDGLLINETPLLGRAVSFTKGCYPGQESVARVHNLGGARKQLRGLRAVRGPVETGAAVRLNGSPVGRVTSVAALDGEVVAIAVLRSEIEPGTTVEAGDATATVVALS